MTTLSKIFGTATINKGKTCIQCLCVIKPLGFRHVSNTCYISIFSKLKSSKLNKLENIWI